MTTSGITQQNQAILIRLINQNNTQETHKEFNDALLDSVFDNLLSMIARSCTDSFRVHICKTNTFQTKGLSQVCEVLVKPRTLHAGILLWGAFNLSCEPMDFSLLRILFTLDKH